MTEKLHAKHSPSSLKSKELCPHWENRPGSSKAADEGTMMHDAADTGHLTASTRSRPRRFNSVWIMSRHWKNLSRTANGSMKCRWMFAG
jgi:hypothetical protein